MDWESFDVVRFDLGTLLQGQIRTANLKSRKSRAGNLLMLGPLLQCQMRTAKLKSAYNLLIIGVRDLQC